MDFSKLLLGTTFLLVASLTSAQTKTTKASIKWGEELNKKNGRFQEMVGHNDENVYHLIWLDKVYQIQKMDKDLNILDAHPLDLEYNDKDLFLEEVIVMQNNVIVLSSFFNKKTDKNHLFMSTYDANTLKKTSKLSSLASIPAEKKKNKGAFGIAIAPDSSKVLVYYHMPYEKDEKEKFGMKVYNEKMELQWEDETEIPYTDEEFVIHRFKVLEDGSVLVMGFRGMEAFYKREKTNTSSSDFGYHVLAFNGADVDVIDYKLKLDDKYLTDLQLAIGNDGNIICAGFYSERGFGIRGCFFATFDRGSKEVLHKSFSEFDDEFITQYMTEKEEKKAKKKAEKKDRELEMYKYDLDEIVLRSDGGAVLVAEQYHMYVTTRTTRDPDTGMTRTTTYYHYVYNDIIVVNVDPQGDIDWTAKIPKRQHTINDDGFYSSYALTVKDDQMYFLFNDSGKNLFLKEGQKVESFRGKDAIVALITVGNDGGVEREALLNIEKKDIVTTPKECVELNDQLFIYAARGKKYKFGRVDFE